ncbi:hypothetical protein TVAG_159570 [Trichomonas vaginalis G3]|uniref:Uncharacterized protein n=1 Tax=Trichomonas vaginalis (strain ATCC PRA-98 / G3) TaxID=412133 RepID=A2F5B2_TRIV3|nr:Ankyrin repeat family [Trichomonas vaginalis G3]EAX99937.1 hypothetical protein TVAG_159570 [Trichomonas vaginalis G3]KAI5547782.1 Ankyrin repeat family [Trichomonas vaginalis G3]|eukprot:XP_001312867.1 hypothetical protein [Trichomonas vaginalis G3]
MQFLISHGIDLNAKDVDGKTALKLAMEDDNTEAAELLLAHGANPNI